MSASIVLSRDETKLAMRGLVDRNPDAARAAGGRVLARATLALMSHEDARRVDAATQLVDVSFARYIALGHSDLPSPPRKDGTDVFAYAKETVDYERLKGYVALFSSLPDDLAKLARLDPANAYVKARGLQGVHYAASHPKPAELPEGSTDPAYWEASARYELALVERENLIGLFLGQEVARIADEHSERLRADDDWWDVCAATLLAEDPGTPTTALGIDADLRSGDWYKSGEGSLFDHRESIRAFAGADPEHALPREVERREKLWALASRAVLFLRDSEQRAAMDEGAGDQARPDSVAPVPPGGPQSESSKPQWARVGTGWEVIWDGQRAILPHTSGMEMIRLLLQTPNKAISADVLSPGGATASTPEVEHDEDSREFLEAAATRLRNQIVAARERGDESAEKRLLADLEAVAEQVARAPKPDQHRRRRRSPDANRARARVASAIEIALKAVAAELPDLHRHLAESLRDKFGMEPCYAPKQDPGWLLGGS